MLTLPFLVIVVVIAFYLFSSLRILAEYERGVISRMGRPLLQVKGPGLIFVFAPLERMARISMLIDTLEVPPQEVVTRDNVSAMVNAVIYFRVVEPLLAAIKVTNFIDATAQLAQTMMRSVLSEVGLDELLSKREQLNIRLQGIIDKQASAWGVKVSMVEVRHVDLAEQTIRALARQTETEREQRARIKHILKGFTGKSEP